MNLRAPRLQRKRFRYFPLPALPARFVAPPVRQGGAAENFVAFAAQAPARLSPLGARGPPGPGGGHSLQTPPPTRQENPRPAAPRPPGVATRPRRTRALHRPDAAQ